ncbi:MAG TPA: hypothetical protein VHX38_31175 [Pseudonocardiaceae bacterium]|nr:hypothetical protein [Pseudonocardiaceae bacterium]
MHLASSIGWLGMDASLLVLGIVGLTTSDPVTVRASFVSAGALSTYLLPILSLLALVTGIVLALGSGWGLFRHWWVLISLVLTTVVTVAVLLALAPMLRESATQAASLSNATLIATMADARVRLVVAPAAALIVLVFLTGMNVHKPWGRVGGGASNRPTAVTTAGDADPVDAEQG